VPSIVVERELQSPQLRTLIRVPGLAERFYAITMARRFGNPLIEEVVASFRQKLKSFAALSTRGNTVPA
jgi:LysR family transcriptional activator of nhaA